jgi:UDP-GlcNAc3NAcA epimerase
MKLLTIIGARPQFIKAATVSRALKNQCKISEIIIHTGQHYDRNMSEIFFEQLDIPKPQYSLGVSGGSHGVMTGQMMVKVDEIIEIEKPNWILVYGDTNSTLAGALCAAKAHVPVAHVEAGLRSFNPKMPEEINRILTDRVSNLLFCPSELALKNLHNEGFPYPSIAPSNASSAQRAVNVGDVMYDAVLYYRNRAINEIDLNIFGVKDQKYILATIHRQENADNPKNLINIMNALSHIAMIERVVMPMHPRTALKLSELNYSTKTSGIKFIDPLSYLEMQRLQLSARMIITDSGGVQKEAFFHQVPCITLRTETEWAETLDDGSNTLTGPDTDKILDAWRSVNEIKIEYNGVYGDGRAAENIINQFNNLEVP